MGWGWASSYSAPTPMVSNAIFAIFDRCEMEMRMRGSVVGVGRWVGVWV